MNVIPANKILLSAKTLRLNSVPAIAKNIAYSGGVRGSRENRIRIFFLFRFTSSIPSVILEIRGESFKLIATEVERKIKPRAKIFISFRFFFLIVAKCVARPAIIPIKRE